MPKTPLTNQIHMERLCDPVDESNSVVEHFHKFSCQEVQTTIG